MLFVVRQIRFAKKKQMAKGNVVAYLIIGAIVLVALGVFKIPGWGSTTDSTPTPTGGSDCDSDPVISFSAVDALAGGTSFTPVVYARVNGAYMGAVTDGTTKFTKGDQVDLLFTHGSYIDVIKSALVMGCGTNRVTASMYANGTDTTPFSIYNSGNSLLTDSAAGGTNQSAITTSADLEMRIAIDQDKSSGDMVIVVEGTNTTQIDRLIISGFPGVTKVSVPDFYSVAAAGSVVEAYQISPINDGSTATGFLKISAESGQTVDKTAVYVTGYIPQAFVDDDGTYKTGIEDSDGTTKYQQTVDFDFMVD